MLNNGVLKLNSIFRLMTTLILVLVGGVQESLARQIHYGAVTDPMLLICDQMAWQGKETEARHCYRDLLSITDKPEVQAEISWALADLNTANRIFQSAIQLSPDNAEIRQRWGDLFMETYQFQDAMDLYSEALEIEPDNGYARVGMAHTLVERFQSEAVSALAPVIENIDVASGARLQAILLLTRIAIEKGNRDRVANLLDEASTLADNAQLPKLEIYALRATVDLLNGKDDSHWIDLALSEHPSYGDVYAIPGYYFWITRRYREAVNLFQKAVEVQPDHWQAHTELGINLLRTNEISLAHQHLKIAYQGDPYNPKTANTLRLLDDFDDFELVHFPEQPPQDGFPRLTLRLHKDERQILTSYVRKLADKALSEFTDRYQFHPREPVVIEIYPNHEDFIVRTTGMPGLGILGATFGYLLAMDSPSEHSDNEYHWGTALWHEIAHVYTLEMTDHLVPRWFSEGVSVFEEWRYGPVKGVKIPINVLLAISQDKFLPITELDGGFIRPSYNNQVIVSYMQAGLICQYINDRYGFDNINKMLEHFKQGVDTGQSIRNALGVNPAAFDIEFNKYIDKQFGTLLWRLEEWKELIDLAKKQFTDSNWYQVIETTRKAIGIFPDYVESDSPYLMQARAYGMVEDQSNELNILMKFWQKGGYTPEALKILANRLYQKDRRLEAIAVLDAINFVAPFDVDLHNTLGDWYLQADLAQAALTEYEIVLAMNPHDLAETHYRIARANQGLNKPDEAHSHLLTALEIAPHYRPAQKMLIETIKPGQQ